MIQPQKRKFKDLEVTVAPLLAREALQIKYYLIKLLSPVVGRMFGGFDFDNKDNESAEKSKKKTLLDQKVDFNIISDAIEKLFIELGDDGLMELTKKLFKNITVVLKEGGKVQTFPMLGFSDGSDESLFDIVFQGRLLSIPKILLFVLEVNFPDFFELVGDFGNRFQTLMSNLVKNSPRNEPNELEKSVD